MPGNVSQVIRLIVSGTVIARLYWPLTYILAANPHTKHAGTLNLHHVKHKWQVMMVTHYWGPQWNYK